MVVVGGGCRWGLGADDLTGPGLMLGPWVQVGDHHVHGLELLVLGGDGTHLVGDLVPFHGHILALDAAGDTKRVSACGGGV